MSKLKHLIILAALAFLLLLSLLFVLLNTQLVSLDFLGLFMIEQSLGILLIASFVLGVIFCLVLLFIPSLLMQFRNKRLNKKLSSN